MKTVKLTLMLLVFAIPAVAQTTQIENLHQFDKIIVSGDVTSIELRGVLHERPMVTVDNVSRENVTANVEAGTLYLDVKNGRNVEVRVYNNRLDRLEGPAAMKVEGAEVVGNNGKYVVMSYHKMGHQGGMWADHDFDFNFDFDFDHDFDINMDCDFDWDHDFDCKMDWKDKDWKTHVKVDMKEYKEELKEWSREVKREMKEAMAEVKREVKVRIND